MLLPGDPPSVSVPSSRLSLISVHPSDVVQGSVLHSCLILATQPAVESMGLELWFYKAESILLHFLTIKVFVIIYIILIFLPFYTSLMFTERQTEI